MDSNVFNFKDYKAYLNHVLATSGENRGKRAKLAAALKCQTAFVSQVLNGTVHFSLEHGIQISRFLGHSKEEAHFFVLLLHYGRAGSKALEEYYREQIDVIREQRQTIRERIQVKRSMSPVDQMTYYSAWYYAAIHILLLNPQFRTKKSISERLKLPMQLVSDCLDFLTSVGLAEQKGEIYKTGETRIHLGKDSPMLPKHHTNWRMRAVHSFDCPANEDLHYSSVISVSEEDVIRLRTLLLEMLEKSEQLLRASGDEALMGISVDYFRV